MMEKEDNRALLEVVIIFVILALSITFLYIAKLIQG